MNESNEAVADRVSELLLAWEDSVAAGHPLSASTLCSDSPELEPELDREIRLLQNLNRFMFASATPVAFSDKETVDGSQVAGLSTHLPTLPGYEILAQIGRGGMGVVYRARQQSLERFVAIKTLAGSRWAQPEFVARLRQEARALSQLNHPHVVHVFDVVDTDASVSLVLEYVDGGNLAQRLNGMPISSREAAQFALTLARTLTSVHARGILHRDIKPANVLLNRAGEIKIADFGLAKELGTESGQTVTGEPYGSPCYMAPEQANGRRDEISARTDVYAIGATLYEMLTGRPPFIGTSTIDTLNQVLKRDPVALRVLNPGIPRDLETICLKCLEKKADRRFDSATELADELQRFLDGIPIHSRPISVVDRSARWCMRHPGAAGLVAVSAAAAMAITAIIISSNTSHQRHLTKFNDELTRLNNDLIAETAKAKELQQIAEENAQRAKESENRAKDGLYASDFGRAATAWKHEDTRSLTEILDRHIPEPGELDRRGFEWWYLYRQTHLNSRLLLKAGSPQYILCEAPDHRWMAAAGKDAVVRLFQPGTGDLLKSITTGQIEVNGIAFSPDGTEVATAGDDGSIRIWNLESGSERKKITTDFRKAYDVLYGPDGIEIIACGNGPEISIFDARTGRPVSTLRGHTNVIESLVLGDDGKTLISASNDKTVRVWNLTERTERTVINAPDNVSPMVYDQERKLLITGNSAGVVRTIDVGQARELGAVKHLDRIGSLALHPNGSLLAVGDAGGRIRLRQIGRTGEFLSDRFQPWQAHQGNVYFLVWSQDGSQLFSSGKDGRILSWSLEEMSRPAHESFRVDRATDSWPFAETPASTLMIQRNDSLVRWNSQVRLYPRREEAMYSQFCVSQDKKFLATLNNAGVVELYAIPKDHALPIDNDLLATWKTTEILKIIGFTTESEFLAIVDRERCSDDERENSRISLLQLPGLDLVKQIPIDRAKYPVLSPNGKRIAFANQEDVIVWDISENRIVWKKPQINTRQMVFSPDGQLIATAAANRSITIWDSTDGTVRVQLTNHRSLIREMLFSSDNLTLVTATQDRSIIFSHVVTGQELLELPNVGNVHRLEFSADGRSLFCQTRSNEESNLPDDVLVFDASKELVGESSERK